MSNIIGFFNILELVKKYKIKKLFYASSSSVYGEKKIFPTREEHTQIPTNIYSLSKNINEKMSEIYFNLNKVIELLINRIYPFTEPAVNPPVICF